ncbi:MAG: GntR family transcriptional regulator [Oscillospiraceae bacterium]|nr:GntR family transcriptional regulator [Oscillospiraceae bacterium]
MKWEIDESRPIHAQLVEDMIRRIVAGEYRPGERIASVRDLAFEAKVNPNTMQKALAELESRGILITQRTSGRFVTEDHEKIVQLKQSLSQELLANFVADMRNLGYTKEAILGAVEQALKKSQI